MDSRIREAYESGYSRGHNDTVESRVVSAELAAEEYGGYLLTAETEPCEDAKILAGRILAHAKPQTWPDQIEEYAEHIESYASQVADKRAEELRKPLRWFAGEMEKKLKENDWKEQWPKLPNKQLVDQLDVQGPMLVAAIISGDASEIIRRSVNLANYSMMLADKAREAIAATEPKP